MEEILILFTYRLFLNGTKNVGNILDFVNSKAARVTFLLDLYNIATYKKGENL